MDRDLGAILEEALRACDPARLLTRTLTEHPVPPDVPVAVVAAGKAAQPMADAFVRVHPGPIREVLVAGGSHPVPDVASVKAGVGALALAAQSRALGDRLIVLLSGGASSMMVLPADGLPFTDKIAMTGLLLRSGLPIGDINAIRKHLSGVKGGQLAAAAGRSMTFALSDVHGPVEDDPAVIGSGPTVGDPTTFADAERALRAARLMEAAPASVRSRLARGLRGEVKETIKPCDPRLASAEFVLAGSRRDAMDGAREAALALGYEVDCLAGPIVGEASLAAAAFMNRVRGGVRDRSRPRCVIASGETTVTLPLSGATGRGGRNQEFALAAARGLQDLGHCVLASIGTDGIDGPTDAAGAFVDQTTMARAGALGLDADRALRGHDAYPFFQAIGDLIVTGPTGTNVGDLQEFLARPGA